MVGEAAERRLIGYMQCSSSKVVFVHTNLSVCNCCPDSYRQAGARDLRRRLGPMSPTVFIQTKPNAVIPTFFPQSPLHRFWSSSTRSVGPPIIPIPKNGLLKFRNLDWLMVNYQLALRKSNLHSRFAYGHPCTPCTVN